MRLCARMRDAGRSAGKPASRSWRCWPAGWRRRTHSRPPARCGNADCRRLGRRDAAGRFPRLGLDDQVVRRRELQASVLQQGQGTAVQRQASHELHHRLVRSGLLLRGAQALRLRLVRDAAQHDVVGQRREDDRGVPWTRRRGADDSDAGSARVEHSEGDRPRGDRSDLPDHTRRSPGAGSGAVLAFPTVWPSQLRARDKPPRSGPTCRAATRTRSTTTCSSS